MIGRADIVIVAHLVPYDAVAVVARAVTRYWESAYYEDAITADRFDRLPEIPFAKLNELFVYRDRAAYESWDELGADPSNANTMVHVLGYEDYRVTIVVDDPANPMMARMLDSVRQAVLDRSRRMGSHMARAA